MSHLKLLTYLDVSECFVRALPDLNTLPLRELHASYTLGLKQLPHLPSSYDFEYNFILFIFIFYAIVCFILICVHKTKIVIRLTTLNAAEKIESIGVDIRHLTNLTTLNIRSNLIRDVQDLNGN